MMRTARFAKDMVSGITSDEWDQVSAAFAKLEVGRDMMPHHLGNAAGIDYTHARAILLALEMCGLAENYLYVYHKCADAPLTARRLSEGFMPLPWTCPQCDHVVTERSELRYDLACRTRTRIRFV